MSQTSRKLIFRERELPRATATVYIYTIRKNGVGNVGEWLLCGGGSFRSGGPDGVRPFLIPARLRLYHMLAR